MIVRIRLFGQLRELAGADVLERALPDGATVADALDELERRPPLDDLLARLPVRMAVNREVATPDTLLRAVGADPIVATEVTDSVRRAGAGAVVTFEGTVRDVEYLDYEAYREMAEEQIEKILGEAIERHGLEAAAAVHRIGRVPLGEPGVVVAVAAAHRDAAFAGAREVIDEIKARVPIWKRELDRGEARWVPGEHVSS
jgi:molybdopterin synthase catalytic subunit/molybdopterin converting factor small subunit